MAAGLLLCFGAALLLRAVFFAGPYLPPSPLPQEKIIDMHCHVAGLGGGGSGCFVNPRLRNGWKFHFYLRSFGASREELIERGDALIFDRIAEWLARSRRVGKAVILAMDGAMDAQGRLDKEATEFYVPNDFVARETARRRNLLFGASVNPYRPDAIKRLRRAAAQGACLVKWIPSIQGIDPADPKLTPFYKTMAKLGLPLLTHTGRERSFSRADDRFADPQRLRLPLQLGVTVIAAHAASTGSHEGRRDIDRLADMLPQFPNLYADISSLTQINKLGYLGEVLTRAEFRGRLVYGTDFPLINMPLVSPWFFPLRLRWEQMRRISRIANPWDRDVALKQALGAPTEVFRRAETILRLKNRPSRATHPGGEAASRLDSEKPGP
ncbi:MAG: amidohydrolase family protein [Verrucomicrobia bacterium]|nr:amidohydrolase family protein [Verrucomicrobiota bacterium]